ncbi:MAG: hypothetical protein JWP00_1076 [Chloroflexi bacterium]|jgi:hypothetical protein|nr:hypothetical protein [Chloroflexota bacterium]
MSGKSFTPKYFAYRMLIWSVVLMFIVSACGNEVTPTAVTNIPPTALPGPTASPTVAFTSTPIPTPTPTEIPIVLPTATPPNPYLPQTQQSYVPAFTKAPTYTPVPTDQPRPTDAPYPTDLPAPTITPYVAPYVVPLSVSQRPIVGPFSRLDYILPPAFTTQCIAAQYFGAGPGGSGSQVISGSKGENGSPSPTASTIIQSYLEQALPDQWSNSFQRRYFADPRLNGFLLPAPTFTPNPTSTRVPTDTPLPTWTPVPSPTPLPYNTPDVFTGLTAAPPAEPTAPPAPPPTPRPTITPRPTATAIVPTWTPSFQQRFQSTSGFSSLQSIFISDVTSALNGFSEKPINFIVMWQVMNDLTLALVNVDTPVEVHLRAYEEYMDKTINILLNRSLKDPSIPTSGEARYANRKMIIGNVPDLKAFRFFSPCFTQERLTTIQNQYNAIINRVAAKYAGKVYVADLNTINWSKNPQWVSVQNGYDLSIAGADAVADVFGKVFLTLKF